MGKIKKHIVKRKGHRESYDERKVYASVYAASLNCHYSKQKSKKIAKEIMKKVTSWIKNKSSIDSAKIREQVIKSLKDKHVTLMYKHHLDLG